MISLRRILTFVFTVALATSLGFAGSTGKIAGRVTDNRTGEPLPGANVVIEGTTMGASADIEGRYVILNVPPGHYTVLASFLGYRRMQVTDIRVSTDFTTTVDFALEEGNIELEVVTVQGEATPLIRKDLTNPVASISSEAINELPVTEISQVIGLQAGVTVGDDGVIHIRGGYGNEIAYTLNGVNINNPYGNTRSVGLATNAVQEVSVSSGTFSAEYGGGLSGVVNYVTKDGGKSYTGGIRYLTGDHVSSHKAIFDHIDLFQPFNVYRFEASLGGPIPLMNDLTFYSSGVYNYDGGSLYGQRLYRPEDSYLSREGFPSSDPRTGASTDPYYFAPFSRSSTDLVGGPTGDGATVPLDWSKSYNLQGNLLYRYSPKLKLKYELVYDVSQYPATSGNSSAFANRYKPDGRRIVNGRSYVHTFDLTHVLSDRAFYTAKFLYGYDLTTSWVYDSPSDPRYLPSYYLQTLGNTGYLTGGTDLYRFRQRTHSWTGKIDFVAQMFEVHEIKAGLVATHYKVYEQSYTLLFQDRSNPGVDPSPTNYFTGLYHFVPVRPTVQGGYITYNHEPTHAAVYVQDKIELFQSIILNMGVRYEYFDPAGKYNPNISEELVLQDSIFLYKNLQDAKPKQMIQPRLSVSYPITDRGTIHLSYGHFYQIGSLSSLYSNPNFRAPLGTNPSFGNPNVSPQKSVQYELGFQQGLTDRLKIEVTAYYKDVRDYIYNQTIITPRGDKQYSLLTNLSYANTRGLSFSLLKLRGPGDPLSLAVDYTFQVAEGNRTQPTDEIFFNEQKGQLSETYLVPLSFDRSHTINGRLTLTSPNDWVISMIGYVRTGRPYTPVLPTQLSPITYVQNSARQPMQWNVDLKVEKIFQLGPMEYSVFLQVDNLFDVENELYVYANSGSALYNVEQTLDPTQYQDVRNRIERGDPGMVPISAIDNYYANPGNLSTPRLVRLGLSVNF